MNYYDKSTLKMSPFNSYVRKMIELCVSRCYKRSEIEGDGSWQGSPPTLPTTHNASLVKKASADKWAVGIWVKEGSNRACTRAWLEDLRQQGDKMGG